MPERLAATDPAKQVTDIVGSGPYRFLADEHVAGARVAHAKFDAYVPRPAKWTVMPDSASAATALQAGEMDWWELPALDLVPLLKRAPRLAIHADETAVSVGDAALQRALPIVRQFRCRRALLP